MCFSSLLDTLLLTDESAEGVDPLTGPGVYVGVSRCGLESSTLARVS